MHVCIAQRQNTGMTRETARDRWKGGRSASGIAGEGRRRRLSARRGAVFWVLQTCPERVGRGLDDLRMVARDVEDETELEAPVSPEPQIRRARQALFRAYRDVIDERFARQVQTARRA